jgi:hypothetical protein
MMRSRTCESRMLRRYTMLHNWHYATQLTL